MGKFDCAGSHKAGFLAQFVITLALPSLKLELPDIAMRNLALEIFSVIQAQKMTDEPSDNAGMNDKEKGLSGT